MAFYIVLLFAQTPFHHYTYAMEWLGWKDFHDPEQKKLTNPEILLAFEENIREIDELLVNEKSEKWTPPRFRLETWMIMNERLEQTAPALREKKKKLFETKVSLLQIWIERDLELQSYRMRTKGNINFPNEYSLSYDYFVDYSDEITWRWRLRFPIPKLKWLELLADQRYKEWTIENTLWVNYFRSVWENKYQFGLWVNDWRNMVVSSRIKTVQWAFWTKHILTYEIGLEWREDSVRLRNELTYAFLEELSLLMIVKTKIDPESVEINPAIGLEYRF